MNTTVISSEVLAPRVGVIGYVKIGQLGQERSKKGKPDEKYRLPEKLDFFRVTTRVRGTDGNFVRDDAVHAVIGEKPTELDFRLLFDELGPQNYQARMTEYEGRTAKTICNGQESLNPRTGVTGPCPRAGGRQCGCKPNGRLAMVLEASTTFGGAHVFRSTSWETVANLQTTLRLLRSQIGSLRGLPLRLQLYKTEVQYQEKGETKVGDAWKATVVLRATYEEAAQAALEFLQRQQITRAQILELASGFSSELSRVDAEDDDMTRQEFFPEGDSARQPTRIGRLNRALGAGKAEADPVDALISEVRAELARVGTQLDAEPEGRILAAITARDESNLRIAIDWLAGFKPTEPAAGAPQLELGDTTKPKSAQEQGQ